MLTRYTPTYIIREFSYKNWKLQIGVLWDTMLKKHNKLLFALKLPF